MGLRRLAADEYQELRRSGQRYAAHNNFFRRRRFLKK
jgi:hypothetical protein